MQIIVTGHKEIDAALAVMPERLQKSIVRKSIRQAVKPALALAKKKIPDETGQFKTTLKIRALPRLKVNRNVVGVRIITDEEILWHIHPRIRSVFNAVWAEMGVPGHLSWGTPDPLPARPWFRPAMHQARPIVLAAFEAEMRSLLNTKFWVAP